MITAHWRIKCNVECPYCEDYIDLMDIQYSFEWLPKAGESDDIEVEVECPNCKRDFTVQNVEY